MKKLNKIIKNIFKRKNITIIFLLLMIIIIIILLFKVNSLSPIEEHVIKDYSNDYTEYLDIIEDSDRTKLDRYICYAVKYLSKNENKETISIKEVNKFIKKHFTIKTSIKKISAIGISPYMVKNNITIDSKTDDYKLLDDELSNTDIATKKIVKYDLIKIKKKNNYKYELTYNKYVVTNPYKVLNYYLGLDSKKQSENYSITEIEDYLKGKTTEKTFKTYITSNNISKVGKNKGNIKVTYIVNNDGLVLDNIK